MDIVFTIALLVMVAVGVALIRRIDARHQARIATFHYSETVPGIRRRPRKHRRPTDKTPEPGADADTDTDASAEHRGTGPHG